MKPSMTTTAAPSQLLGELFGPLLGGNQGDTKIRDPRAGQGLVETAIKATKAVSQLMGSVLQVKQFKSPQFLHLNNSASSYSILHL
jgi:hypothetical protein